VQIIVNRLRNAALVAIERNPAHRRSALVALTNGGRSVLAAAPQADLGFAKAFPAPATAAEVRSAIALLRRLRQSLDKPKAAHNVGRKAIAPRKTALPPETEARFSAGVPPESAAAPHELPVSLL
jgi:hypothetical protein